MKISKYNRIYVDGNLEINSYIPVNDAHSHYLVNVLRLRAGDKVRIFNKISGEYMSKIYNFGSKDYRLEIIEKLRDPENYPPLIAAPALIKNDRFITSLEKSVELGVSEISPTICERSQLRNLNISRLEKSIIEATEQSERLTIPKLNTITLFSNFIQNTSAETIIVCNENEKEFNSIKNIDNSKIMKSLAIIVGPEGGFSDNELKILASNPKVISVSLGYNLLRSETAMLAALSQIQLMRL